ncbi:MAG: cytochrome c oxidase assembly protein [Alphaproteobacteria bacterium]
MSSNKSLGIILFAGAVSMVALAYASVPIYQIFCQQTGFAGTPRLSLVPSQKVINRTITVQFTADTHSHLPWKFKPLQNKITLKVGENGLSFFEVQNLTDQPIVGMATFNVTPEKAAPYFNKVACFCYERQTLLPHERREMPLLFFVDTDLANNPQLDDIKLITMSYTFFRLKE